MTRINITEVGPRDGLQNEPRPIPTAVKVAFIDALSRTGVSTIEVSSFVSPKWVPQLADAEDVFRGITRKEGVRYTALVPNVAGLERALRSGVDGVAVFTAASETFNRHNTNASTLESIERLTAVISRAPVPVRGYVSTAFHCPYEGAVPPAAVVALAERLLDLGCTEISIGDTIGQATPTETRQLVTALLARCRIDRLALHFHDTHGRAISNALAGAELGIYRFDASAGGLGGCPFAPGAPGNVATEALVKAFPGRTGLDPAALAAATAVVQPYRTSATH